MAVYLTLADCLDPALVVTDDHVDEADVFIALSLREMGLSDADIAGIVLPNPILRAIAVAWARRAAAVAGALGEDSPLIDKARQYEKTATALAAKLNRAALGIAYPAGAGFGGFTVGRA